jgi:proteasome lid subunit RPN8/RPN11
LTISRRILDLVADHARQSAPRECCGILLYTDNALSTVNCAIPAENIDRENPENGYVLDHKAHLKALEMEISGGGYIAGYYHSHPAGRARPSRRDLEQAIDGVTYLITGMADGRIEHAAWRFDGDKLVPEPIEMGE